MVHTSVTRMSGWDVWNSNAEIFANSHAATNEEPAFLCFDIKADGFLYNMVRAIVGTLIHVGRGRWDAEDMHRILTTGDRTHAGETAPPQGLSLMQVDY